MLNITAHRLNRAIQISATLQATVDSIQEIGKGVSEAAIKSAVESRIALGRVAGLDSLIDLASMPIDENSAQNQVKLAAAARLAGGLEHATTGGAMADTFKELAELYQQHAPRVRLVRERVSVEIEAPTERAVNDDIPQE